MSVSAANGAGTAAMVTRDQMAAVLAARPGVANAAQQVAATAVTSPDQVDKAASADGVDLYL